MKPKTKAALEELVKAQQRIIDEQEAAILRLRSERSRALLRARCKRSAPTPQKRRPSHA